MGSGSSCNKVETFDKGNQASSKSVPDRSTSSPNSPLFKHVSSKPVKRQTFTQDDIFQLDPNIEEYSSVWDPDTKLSASFQQSVRSVKSNIDHHQRETFNNKRSKKTSTTFNSTHVESTVDTETHSCINLSSSEKIDELIRDLNHIHTQLDDIIKQRTDQISADTESVLSQICNETQQKQQRLLNYAKDQQSKQDEHYRKLLQDYISQLDQIKAKDLAELQTQLQNYRDQILEESQIKFLAVNQQANSIKAKILHEEQRQAGDKIDLIIGQLQQISHDDKLQHLGSESITRTNIITNANFGSKAPGQTSTFEFEQRPQSKNNREEKRVSVTQRPKFKQKSNGIDTQ